MKNFMLFALYVVTGILLYLTMLDGEEYIMRDIYMATIAGIIYIAFTISWCKLMNKEINATVHTALFTLITWGTLLTIGEILFVQSTSIMIILTGMLISVCMCIYVSRQKQFLLDGLTAASLFIVLYIAMQIEHTIIPGGLTGGMVISLAFLVVAGKKSLLVTKVVGRLVFFMMAFTVLFLTSATPIIAEGGYLLYGVILIIIIAFLLRNKIELLLPKQAMPVLLVLTIILYVVKFI